MTVITNIDTVNNAASFSFYNNNQLTSTFTLAPLLSTITATAVTNPVIVPLSIHVQNLTLISKWISDVQGIFALTNIVPTATNQIYNKSNITSTGTFTINGYTFSYSYNSSSNNFMINTRIAHTFTWGEFLLFTQYNNNFLSQVAAISI